MTRVIIFILLAFATSQSCKRDPMPKNGLTKAKYIDIMVDAYLAEGLFDDRSRLRMDSLNSQRLYLSVLKKHGASEEQVVATTLYYSRNPKEYDKVLGEILAKLNLMNEDLRRLEAIESKKIE